MDLNIFYQRMARDVRRWNIEGGYGWPVKPVNAPAVSRYPNILAEMEAYTGWLYLPAEFANVSREFMAAVLEDNEELSFLEMRGLARLYGCKLDYLAAHTLQVIAPATNKGKRRMSELRSLMEQAAGLEVIGSNCEQVRRNMERGEPVTYAAWRQACQYLNDALNLNRRSARTERRATA